MTSWWLLLLSGPRTFLAREFPNGFEWIRVISALLSHITLDRLKLYMPKWFGYNAAKNSIKSIKRVTSYQLYHHTCTILDFLYCNPDVKLLNLLRIL